MIYFRNVIGVVAGLSTLSTGAAAIDRTEVSSKVLYQAVDQLTDYLGEDLAEISQHTKKTAIIHYTQSEELPRSIQNYLVKRMQRMGTDNKESPVRFVECVECMTLRAVAEGDEIFIKKGLTEEEEITATMEELGIRKYSNVNLAYTGDQLVMQVAVVGENKMVDWAKEYKTPYKAYSDSQWLLGAGVEVGSFSGDIPAAKGGRLSFGQRLTGIGAAGMTVSFFEPNPGVPQIVSYGAFFDLSHNEVMNQYWEFVRLSYTAELGITDFNGNQLIHQTIGVKSTIAKHYTIALNTKLHQFVTTPEDDTPIANDEGESVLNNNEVLPMMISLALGVEIL